MKYCPNCGHPINDGERFCGNCGYNLSQVSKNTEKLVNNNINQDHSSDTTNSPLPHRLQENSSSKANRLTKQTELSKAKKADPTVGQSKGRKVQSSLKHTTSVAPQEDQQLPNQHTSSGWTNDSDNRYTREQIHQSETLSDRPSVNHHAKITKWLVIAYLILGTIGIAFTIRTLIVDQSTNLLSANISNKLYSGTWTNNSDDGTQMVKINGNAKQATITQADTNSSQSYKIVWRKGLSGTKNRKIGYLVNTNNNSYMTFEITGGTETNSDNAKLIINYSNTNNVFHKN